MKQKQTKLFFLLNAVNFRSCPNLMNIKKKIASSFSEPSTTLQSQFQFSIYFQRQEPINHKQSQFYILIFQHIFVFDFFFLRLI